MTLARGLKNSLGSPECDVTLPSTDCPVFVSDSSAIVTERVNQIAVCQWLHTTTRAWDLLKEEVFIISSIFIAADQLLLKHKKDAHINPVDIRQAETHSLVATGIIKMSWSFGYEKVKKLRYEDKSVFHWVCEQLVKAGNKSFWRFATIINYTEKFCKYLWSVNHVHQMFVNLPRKLWTY